MAIDTDDEILQDFLVEAGEILEQLGEQLVDLEQRPQDNDLLNAVFRGFHTVKGGAGFLSITNLVEICHRAEDVFNVLRQGERLVDAELMDVVLRVLDIVNDMFQMVKAGEEPPPADPALIARLCELAKPGSAAPAEVAVKAAPPAAKTGSASAPQGGGDITDDEFEKLLDAVSSGQPVASAVPAGDSEEITDDEFEALLDELHGKGQFHAESHPETPAPQAQQAQPAAEPEGGEEITDDEFEALLDQLHGKGKFSAEAAKPEPAAESSPILAQPAKKAVPAANAVQSDTTVRVDTKRLDDIMNMVGELVLVRNRLTRLRAQREDDEMSKAISNLDVVTADLQLSVMKTRMQPIKKVFGRFPRVVRDLARSLNKDVALEMIGEETDLDKNLVEALADPLVHLVRNSVDHGVEPPADREAAGKPRQGRVILSAQQEGDHILLSIEDDGRGMDPNVLRAKAVEKGMMDEQSASRLSDNDCFNLIFAPGFSTKQEISDVSGRGVGMDVVKTRITQLNGQVAIDSAAGRGTRISIRVPLTLAIMPTLMVVLGEQTFALPLANVVEIFDLDLSRTNVVDGQQVVLVRDHAMPLFYLSDWLVPEMGRTQGSTGHVVVVNAASRQVGFVVDHLIGQEEVVIKPLGSLLQGMPGFAGATITGDGRIALILDVPGLLKKYVRRM